MYLLKDKFLVVGMSKSGASSNRFLLSKGAKCYVFDDSEDKKISDECKKLEEDGAIWVNKRECFDLLGEIDVLVLSPGIAIDHPLPIKAKKLGKTSTILHQRCIVCHQRCTFKCKRCNLTIKRCKIKQLKVA
jgi:UDP-N-acetylmuramoylalanine-D-glutamate ligase